MTKDHSQTNLPIYCNLCIGADFNSPQMRAIEWIRPNSTVLEIGCGNGGVTKLLKEKVNCTVVSVDIDERYTATVSRYAARFVIGDATDERILADIAGPYDYILLFDFLEHLPNPEIFLRKITGASWAVDSRIIATIPNFVVWHVRTRLLCGKFDYTDTGTLDKTHLRFFTPASAIRMFTNSGYEVLEHRYSWHVPILGWLWSKAMIAEIENIEAKIEAKWPHRAKFIFRLINIQRSFNRLGLLRFFDVIGRRFVSLSRTLFANHVILIAKQRGAFRSL